MRQKLEAFLEAGVGTVINLMEENEGGTAGTPLWRYEPILVREAPAHGTVVECHRHPIRDVDVTSPERMGAILDAIDAAIAAGRTVYVHCLGGRGRTGTVVGCWLVRHGMASGATAVDEIRRLRAGVPDAAFPSPETTDQRAMIRNWRG
jgi:hypothetical protein